MWMTLIFLVLTSGIVCATEETLPDLSLWRSEQAEKTMKLYGGVDEEGVIPEMGELLRGAWAMINPAPQTDVPGAVKEQTGSSKTSSAKKRSKPSNFSPDQIAAAKNMYPTKSEKELVELLGKYNN